MSVHVSSTCAHHQEVKIALHSLWYHHTYRWPSRARLESFISVFNQLHAQNLFHNKFYFMPLHVSSTCAHHQEVKIALHSLWYHHTYRWPYVQILCIKLVKYWDKYTEMHGQQNVKKMFWTVSLTIIRTLALYTQQWYMSCRCADC